MGFLSRAVIRALSPEDPSNPLQPGSWLMEALGVTAASSGISVSPEGALKVSALAACVRVLTETLLSMPLEVHQRMDKGTKVAYDHRYFGLLSQAPNPQMTAASWIQGWFAQTLLWGNGYSVIHRDGARRVVGIYPFPSDRTHAMRVNSKLTYVTTATPDGREAIIQPEDMLYIPYLSFDGIQGYSPVSLMKECLGLALAAERFGAMFFGRGSRPSGTLTVPEGIKLSKEAKENLKRTWGEATSGSHALSVALLEEGIKFNPMTVNPEDSQFVEVRKYQDSDIARAFRVPAHLIGILDRATHSNIEQQSLEFIIYTMLPWVIKIEQEINRKLFAGTPYFAKFDMDGLLRGDFQSRTTGYQMLRNAGILSANDIRAAEGWNLIPAAEGGDVYLTQLNQASLEAFVDGKNPNLPPGGDGGDAEDPDDNRSDGDSGDAEDSAKQRSKRVFVAQFSENVGRTIGRQERDVKTVARIWRPALECLAVSLGWDSPSESEFLAGYMATLAHRSQSWRKEDYSTIVENEFDRAYKALMERI